MPDDLGHSEGCLGSLLFDPLHDAATQMDLDHDEQRRRCREEERLQEQERRRMRQQEEGERKRKLRLKGQREIARLSAAHQLNGYDRNVLAQWEASGFNGKRPQLSFELQAAWQSEEDREREQIEREQERHRTFLERLEEERKEAERKRLEREEWRKANPELAAQQDAEEAAERERRRQERLNREAIEAMELALKERHDRIRAFVHHHNPQGLNAEDFLLWAETLATPEELEAFDQDCLKRARPTSFTQAFGFDFWPFGASTNITSET